MRRVRLWGFLATGLLVTMALASCGGSSAAGAQTSTLAPAATATATAEPSVVVAKVKLAKVSGKSSQVLGDLKGKTLYYFTADSATQISCAESCAQLWPPLIVKTGFPTSQSVISGKFGVIDGANGRQVTYNGHPLYTYAKDEDSEDAYGEGAGGKWYAATPSLSVIS